MEKIKHKIMVMSNKGGVGKSTVAINLAYGLSERGKKVGILDADLHGPSLAMMSGSKGEILSDGSGKIIPFEINQSLKIISLALLFKDQDNPIIWRGPLKMKAIKQFVEDVEWGELDYLIIDSPPGTGDEPLSLIQLVANLDGVVIVTTPQGVALLDSRKAVNFVKELNVPVLGIVENMSGFICPHCGTESELFKKGGGEKAAREMGVPFLGRLPLDPKVAAAGDDGRPLVGETMDSPARKNMIGIVDEIFKMLSK